MYDFLMYFSHTGFRLYDERSSDSARPSGGVDSSDRIRRVANSHSESGPTSSASAPARMRMEARPLINPNASNSRQMGMRRSANSDRLVLLLEMC
jgi:hypothetical protein